MTLTSKWDFNPYTITYEANGGTVTSTSTYVTSDTNLTLPTPERTGYTFGGWFTDATLETQYFAEYAFYADTTLYAYWTEETLPTNFKYDKLSDGSIVITKYIGSDAEVNIPKYIGGCIVSVIGDSAFDGCTRLNSVTIPDSITSIGSYAFSGCNSLTSIIFEDTSTWYRTNTPSDWLQMTGGTKMTVTDASANATYFKSTYHSYYWYKK